MFDIGWGEFVVIGAVALVVIGPKELPSVLRTVGGAVSKIRRMAGEFQSQFQEAIREAEFDEARKAFDSASTAVGTPFNPIQTIRDEIKNAVEGAGTTSPAATPSALDNLPEPPPVPDLTSEQIQAAFTSEPATVSGTEGVAAPEVTTEAAPVDETPAPRKRRARKVTAEPVPEEPSVEAPAVESTVVAVASTPVSAEAEAAPTEPVAAKPKRRTRKTQSTDEGGAA